MQSPVCSFLRYGWLPLVVALLAGCATNLTRPAGPPQPTKVRFGEYQQVEMARVSLSERFADSGANQKALRKIDELLTRDMQMLFPKMKIVATAAEFTRGAPQTLLIEPHIKEIKFIGGMARFWAGAMAGSSAVLMQVIYRDSASGEVIADPEFYEQAGAYSGDWTIGGTDNQMLEEIVKEVTNYSQLNR